MMPVPIIIPRHDFVLSQAWVHSGLLLVNLINPPRRRPLPSWCPAWLLPALSTNRRQPTLRTVHPKMQCTKPHPDIVPLEKQKRSITSCSPFLPSGRQSCPWSAMVHANRRRKVTTYLLVLHAVEELFADLFAGLKRSQEELVQRCRKLTT